MGRLILLCLLLTMVSPDLATAEVHVVGCETTTVAITGGRRAVTADPVLFAAADHADLPGTWTPRDLQRQGDRYVLDVPDATHARLTVHSDAQGVVMLRAQGHSLLWTETGPRPGDPYGYGFWSLPVRLTRGDNVLLFALARRGPLSFELADPPGVAFFDLADRTVFDPRREMSDRMPVGVVVVNASPDPLTLQADVDGDRQPLPVIPPMTRRQVPLQITYDGGPVCSPHLRLMRGGETLDEATLELEVRPPDKPYRRTFISGIDGSVQYYAVRPSTTAKASAILLSLHGAGVEALGQARAYAPLADCPIVCPTNRRSFGFDWEDWGRLDALEVLADAQAHLHAEGVPLYLTGHSMGGHGVWQVAVTTPDRFAAVAPSAGWASFDTYPPGAHALQNLPPAYQAATGTSDTIGLLPNLTGVGVYILHGDADDNVPVRQARDMAAALAAFHDDFVLDIQPGRGHWWDDPTTPGAECVTWPPMLRFLRAHAKPSTSEVRRVVLLTANPAVTSTRDWLTIEQQTVPLQRSRVDATFDPDANTVAVRTDNVRRLSIDLHALHATSPTVQIDGSELPAGNGDTLHLLRNVSGDWSLSESPPADEKNSARYGPFKHAFDRSVLLVYGTVGTDEETAANAAMARFHAESFAYRGNGAFEVIPDTAFDDEATRDRNVVLYGNADTNSAWPALLGESPVNASRAGVTVAGPTHADVGLLLVRPRPHSGAALVAAVAADSPAAMQRMMLIPLFTSGVSPPDWAVFDADAFNTGTPVAEGIFTIDWSLSSSE